MAAVAGAAVVAGAAYTTLDVYDVVPGYLTRASAQPSPVPVPGRTTPGPRVRPPSAPSAPAVATPTGPVPTPTALAARVLAATKAQRGMPGAIAMTFRDAATGAHLYDRSAGAAMTPASVTKLLSAWAISHSLDAERTFTTSVAPAAGGALTLVAGGDTCLNPKVGDPDAVCGRAGVGDLAARVAATLKAQNRSNVTLGYDASYAPGPSTAPGWGQDLLDQGFTTRIAQLGLSTQHAETGPAVPDPAASTTNALAAQLRSRGITVTTQGPTPATRGAAPLAQVRSAALLDQLGYALQQSDNAMIESLARQAAYHQGVRANSETAVTGWVKSRLAAGGFDVAHLTLADVCGLSDGTSFPAALLGDLVTRATTGKDRDFADALTRLPVGGWSGTLGKRYAVPSSSGGAGWVRAKTGSLPSVNSLVGTVLDADGRLVAFAIITGGSQPGGPGGARAAIDAVVTAVRGCGC